MIDNNKLAKQLASIYSSSNKARESVVAELAKIDEKYKKLAEQEKEQLNRTLQMLDVQMQFYGGLLGLNNETTENAEAVEETVVEESAKVDEEPVIEDTIFPENNVEVEEKKDDIPIDEAVEAAKAAEVVELNEEDTVFDSSSTKETDQYADIWPEETENPGKPEEKESEEKAGEEDEWPAFPDDWK